MNRELKKFLIIITCIFVGGAAFTYGAMTAPSSQQKQQSAVKTSPSASPKPSEKPKEKELTLDEKLVKEMPVITGVLTEKYPKILTDYTINKGQLYDKGQWFGTTLTYKGSDLANRDTLRVLMEKKDGTWIIRTTPPRPILSMKEYPDVPKKILQAINKPISLPAGAANSPSINPAL